MTIKPIPTHYAGCWFRSRLEARYAVFFNHLNIQWEYEPEGYELTNGRYLPDFRLHGLGGDPQGGSLWFEVKPDIDNREDNRWQELATATGTPLITAFGMPRADQDSVYGSTSRNGWMEIYGPDGEWDHLRAFAACCRCDRIGITYEGRCARICGHEGLYDQRSYLGANVPQITAAYTAAHSARFEHGETP